jgi:beta-glucanase (GH16 family)
MIKVKIILIMSITLFAAACNPSKKMSVSSEYKKLVWSDEFEGEELDNEKWLAMSGTGPEEGFPDFWGNEEKQAYRAENAQVRDGALVIKTKREDFGGMEYTSARLTTSGLYSFTYGFVEARIKLPAGYDGLWPALWMLPQGVPADWSYGIWAASGEIDILESKSRLPGEISAAAHFGGQWPANSVESGTYRFPDGTDAADWHIYGFEWFPDKMVWYADGTEYFRLENWHTIVNDRLYEKPKPFDKPFALTVNCAVGGVFDGGAVPADDFTESEVLVDWIRVYQ